MDTGRLLGLTGYALSVSLVLCFVKLGRDTLVRCCFLQLNYAAAAAISVAVLCSPILLRRFIWHDGRANGFGLLPTSHEKPVTALCMVAPLTDQLGVCYVL